VNAALTDETLKIGMLMESAQAHQKLVEENLARLQAHTRDLDGVVRDEIRRTLIDELQAVTAESNRAAEALRGVKRAAHVHAVVWAAGISALCTVIPGAIVWWVLPSAAQVAGLRAQREELAAGVTRLEQRGGRVQWRLCGESRRLCVRVERKAPAYGEGADYLVVKGY
jgi:hypothetical protein